MGGTAPGGGSTPLAARDTITTCRWPGHHGGRAPRGKAGRAVAAGGRGHSSAGAGAEKRASGSREGGRGPLWLPKDRRLSKSAAKAGRVERGTGTLEQPKGKGVARSVFERSGGFVYIRNFLSQ